MVSHKGLHWGQYHFVSSSMTVTEGPSAHSVRRQMTPSCDTVDLLERARPSRESWTGLRGGLRQPPWSSTRARVRSCTQTGAITRISTQLELLCQSSILTKEEKCILKKQTMQTLLKLVSRIYYYLVTMKNHKLKYSTRAVIRINAYYKNTSYETNPQKTGRQNTNPATSNWKRNK